MGISTELTPPRRPRRASRSRALLAAVTAALATLGTLVLLVTFTPLDYWWATWLAGDSWEDPHGEVLVVLAGSSLTPDTMGPDSYWRGVYAVRVWRSDGFKTILLSGGPAAEPAVLPLRDYLVSQGLPSQAVLLETQSRSTRENALNSEPILSQLAGKKVLLTSDYHVFRARRAFARVGIDLLACSFPDVRKRYQQRRLRWEAFLDLSAETAKIVYYKLRGWI